MSTSIPPNSSSETPDAAPSLGALTARLAEEFGAGPDALALVAAVFCDVRERAPDLFVPAAGALDAALTRGGADPAPILTAVGEWALDAEGEPLERMRRDCQRFQAGKSVV